jgi:hypothetical protein
LKVSVWVRVSGRVRVICMVGADGDYFYFRRWFEKKGARVQAVGRENVRAIGCIGVFSLCNLPNFKHSY